MSLDLRLVLCDALDGLARRDSRHVILIGGAGSLGKSTFAKYLRHSIADATGLATSVLDLDCYLAPRAVREAKNPIVTGYDPAGYDLQQAATDIDSLLHGTPIIVSPYEKVTSRKGPAVSIEPAPIVIVEGVMALFNPILPFGTVRLFFDASHEVLYRNRRAREEGLGFDLQRIERKFIGLMEDYALHVVPQKAAAQIVVDIGLEYQFLSIAFRSTV
jgi:uridine kinase